MIRTAPRFVASLALLALALPAKAEMITQTQGFMGQPNLSKIVEFTKFNPAYGTLTGVEWRFDLGIEGGSLTVDNDGTLPATVSVQLGAIGSLSSTDVRMLNEAFQSVLSGNAAVRVSTGSEFELAGDNGDGMTFDPTMPDADTHEGGINSAVGSDAIASMFLEDYVGTDMFEVTVDVSQLLDFGSVGGVSGQFDPVMAAPNVTLTYHFVPEPAATAAGLWGAALLIHCYRRRKFAMA